MTNPFAAALTTLNVSLAQLDYVGQDCDGVKESMAQVRAAIRVLEAAGLLFPLFDLPEDDKWYRLTANIKRMKERPGITVDCPSIILESLPDAGRKELVEYFDMVKSWCPYGHLDEKMTEAIRSLILSAPDPPQPSEEERMEMVHWLESWLRLCKKGGNCAMCVKTEGGEAWAECDKYADKIRALILAPKACVTREQIDQWARHFPGSRCVALATLQSILVDELGIEVKP